MVAHKGSGLPFPTRILLLVWPSSACDCDLNPPVPLSRHPQYVPGYVPGVGRHRASTHSVLAMSLSVTHTHSEMSHSSCRSTLRPTASPHHTRHTRRPDDTTPSAQTTSFEHLRHLTLRARFARGGQCQRSGACGKAGVPPPGPRLCMPACAPAAGMAHRRQHLAGACPPSVPQWTADRGRAAVVLHRVLHGARHLDLRNGSLACVCGHVTRPAAANWALDSYKDACTRWLRDPRPACLSACHTPIRPIPFHPSSASCSPRCLLSFLRVLESVCVAAASASLRCGDA